MYTYMNLSFRRNNMILMWIKILLILLSLYEINAENNELISKDALIPRMLQFEKSIHSYSVQSTYVRAIVWNKRPQSEKLEKHFRIFSLLKFDHKWINSDNFDIIEKSDFIYERFVFIHYPEEQSFVTVFIRVTFQKDEYTIRSISYR